MVRVSIATLASCVFLLLALGWIFASDTSTKADSSVDPGVEADAPGSVGGVDAGQFVTRWARRPIRTGSIRLSVRDAETSIPLPDVVVLPVPTPRPRLIPPSESPPLARTGADGLADIPVETMPKGTTELVCHRPDHVAVVLELTGRSHYDVMMRTGWEALVQCVDEVGAPVRDSKVVVSRHAAIAMYYRAGGVGCPGTARPVWAGATGDSGDVRFSGMPSGTYSVDVCHPAYRAVRCDPAVLSTPGSPCMVTMQTLWAVVFIAASAKPIVAFRHSAEGITQRGGFFSVVHARSELEKKYPGSIVRVGIASGPKRPTAHAVVALNDGSLLAAAAPMQPIKDGVTPVVLEPITPARGVAEVTSRLLCGGVEQREVPLAVGLGEFKLAWWGAKSGDTLVLPAGSYGVELASPSNALASWVQEQRFEVVEGRNQTVELAVPCAVGWVNVVPQTPHGVVDTPLGLSVTPSAGTSFVMANWYSGCDRDPIRLLLPLGRTTLAAHMSGYKEAHRTLDVAAGEETVTLFLDYSN